MKHIRWKYRERINTWEGTIKGDNEPLISIEGGLCVIDLRESRKSPIEKYIPPKYYKIIGLSVGERKQLAEDLVTGENFEKHEANRLAWIADQEKNAKVIREAEEFLKKLQNEQK